MDDAGVKLHCDPVSGTDLKLQEITRGLVDPLYLTAPENDERLFVIEQPGRIRIVQDNILLATPFLDVSSIIRDTGNEQGLLGMAFHPDFATNGRFFINYTRSPDGSTVIAEYTVSTDPGVANPTGKILLTFSQPQSNHNGGMIAFGPDGFLYIGTGDGGGARDQHGPDGNGQNLDTLLGKLLRIDVDSGDPYGIPSTNPFATGGGRPEIWSYGLRNPWRFSFDATAGNIYIGDVGQDNLEEVDVQPSNAAGLNYGWRIMEGTDCFNPTTCVTDGLVQPITEYPHDQGRASITGGYVYRGDCMPDIVGRYFFGDFQGEQIYTFELSNGALANLQDITSVIDPNSDIAGLTSFGEDTYGELYVISRDGKLFKIVPQ